MIRQNYSIKIIKIIFNKIVKQLQKNLYNISQSTYNSTPDIKYSHDLISPKVKSINIALHVIAKEDYNKTTGYILSAVQTI